MQKNILILSLAALLACAHEEVAQTPAERDWEKGLDAARGPQIAPVGPIDTDQGAYTYIRRREQEHDLGSRMTAAGLDEIIAASSQVLASAMALPLFRAGVVDLHPNIHCASRCSSTNNVQEARSDYPPNSKIRRLKAFERIHCADLEGDATAI